MIDCQKVTKRFDSGLVLNSVDLQVPEGQTVALIGPSGCGKSTLLRCLNGLESIDSGVIRVNQTDIHAPGVNMNAVRANIGIVFQQFNLFPHLTVLENVILGPIRVKKVPKYEAIDRAKRLLDRVGIWEKASSYPAQLSGGQQQRVAIARSLAMEPVLMLLDEPTSALDPLMTHEVFSVIQDVSEQGMTLLIVTHELGFARRVADRLLFMYQGQIEEDGTPESIFQQPKSPHTVRFLEQVQAF
ncbi:MAG: amino acid ABC transporter ATP-binding protein [Cyanobacteria bacterium]|nr:amino acid ABC transporter ATP-binding protein [Cyanobacteriota bacterium]